MNLQANAERFKNKRWDRARDEISRFLIPMLIEVFGLPGTIHLRKYPHDDAFAVFDEWVHLGDCMRPAGGGPVYVYRPLVKVSLIVKVRAFFWVLCLRLLRLLRIVK